MQILLRTVLWSAVLGTAAVAQPTPELWADMKARAIGPSGMSGRVAAVACVPGDSNIVYVGAATGGLWKSTNAGLTWEPIFDDQPVASIGSIAIHPKHPDQVWVGTGEGNPRNSASVGEGLFRTMDGGATWKRCGLLQTERIHRVVLHPDNPDVAFVAALGKAWGESEERGVFRTTDGGQSWEKVLYANASTGCSDLVMDPENPDKLFAGLWDYRRWPWSFRSGGPGSGVHVSHDGGDTWKKLGADQGLPKGDYGRIGLAVAPSDRNVVYALIEAKKNVLARSNDGGETWSIVNRSDGVAPRPFYYCDIRVDPERPDRVYNLHSVITVSNDGGKSFETLVAWQNAHPDHHAMWIDPSDPRRLIIGNDGGVYFSHDRGANWRFTRNLPLAQFYHIRVDMDRPYNVYGGLQDNGSWRGPSVVWENGQIRSHHWAEVGFGDGFDTSPDPEDSMQGYAMSQQGYLSRWDLRTGERRTVRPWAPDDTPLRFNWNAGFAQDPFDPATIWFGSQFVHVSNDRGESWRIVSKDLTTNDPEKQKQAESGGLSLDVTGAENFTTIVSIEPSPVERGVVWVGTDDGRVHVTQDGARSWTSVEANVPDVPKGTWCPQIVADRYQGGAAFAVFDDHRRSNWAAYVYRTEDYGRTWRSIVTDEVRGYCLSIAQDVVDPNLLFLGTEFGLWVSMDAGGHWHRFDHGVPTVAVKDLVVHPREQDLIVGTHGRAVFIVDDIRPLRGMATAGDFALFDVPPAQQHRVRQTDASRFPGQGEFRGENRAYGAMISFWIGDEELPMPGETADAPKHATVTIHDAAGDAIVVFDEPVHRGLNRISWNLRMGFRPQAGQGKRAKTARPSAMEVLPGEYRVTVAYGDHEATKQLTVLADPRFAISMADRLAKQEAMRSMMALQQRMVDAMDEIDEARKFIDAVMARAKKGQDALSIEPTHPAAQRVKMPDGSFLATLNGAKNVEPPEWNDGVEYAPAFRRFKRDDQEWYMHLDGTSSTTSVIGGRSIVMVASPTKPKSLADLAKAAREALKKADRHFRAPDDVQGISARDNANSDVGFAMGSLGSTWTAPSPTHQRRMQRVTKRAEAAMAGVQAAMDGAVSAFRQAASKLELDRLDGE